MSDQPVSRPIDAEFYEDVNRAVSRLRTHYPYHTGSEIGEQAAYCLKHLMRLRSMLWPMPGVVSLGLGEEAG